ncbi:FEN-1 [Callinectes sapidus nudivirus]|nr:FEN-1 [Callinectes sapidus nudivirus]
MGIYEFRRTRINFLDSCKYEDLCAHTKGIDLNLYFDGTFFMFSGLIQQNLNFEGTSYISQKVAETACTIIYNKVTKFAKNKRINEVHIFFDGIRPTSKKKTMALRKMKNSPNKNIPEIINHMIYILNDHNYIITNLVIGESEHEMMIHRDVSHATILISDDSDLFHISYARHSRTFNDFVYINMKADNMIYDIAKIHEKNFRRMPRLVFTLLCSLKGSDFTHNMFTATMMRAILSIYSNNKRNESATKIINDIAKKTDNFRESEIQVEYKLSKMNVVCYNNYEEGAIETISGIYDTSSVCWVIHQLLKLLLVSDMPFTWNRMQKQTIEVSDNYIDDISKQIAALTWSVNYSLIGCRYDEYFNVIDFPTNIDYFKFYYYICCIENDDVYDKLKTINLENVDKRMFLKKIKSQLSKPDIPSTLSTCKILPTSQIIKIKDSKGIIDSTHLSVFVPQKKIIK